MEPGLYNVNVNFKNTIADILYSSGILRLSHRLFYDQHAVILMYHRVLPSLPGESSFVQPGMYVTKETFQQHVAFLKEKFEVISLIDLLVRLYAGKSVAGCCAITFDDGWRDNYIYAFEILQKFQLPSTVFLASAFIGTNKCFWPEKLSFYLSRPEIKKVRNGEAIVQIFFEEVPAAKNKEVFLDNAIQVLKSWLPEKRDELFECFYMACKCSISDRLLMNWEEVMEMHKSGLVDFGAHTANHIILDQVSCDQAREEIVQSRKEIEDHLSAPVKLFAYPNGNFNTVLQKMVAENNFVGAVTTETGWVDSDADKYAVPRIALHEDVSKTCSRLYARMVLQRF